MIGPIIGNFLLILLTFCFTFLIVCPFTAAELLEFKAGNELNQSCQVADNCRSFAYICAANSTCQCNENYRPNDAWTSCIGAIGQRCKYDAHCSEGGFCKNQTICECKEEMHVNPNDPWSCSGAVNMQVSAIVIAICTVLSEYI